MGTIRFLRRLWKESRHMGWLITSAGIGLLAARCVWLSEFRVASLAWVAASPAFGLSPLAAAFGAALGLLSQGMENAIRIPMVLLLGTGIYLTCKREKLWLSLAMMVLAQAGNLLFLKGQIFLMMLQGIELVAATGVMLALWLCGRHICRKSILPPGQAILVMTVAFAVLLCGLPGIYETPFSPCMAIMALATMAAGSLGGPAVGCAAGIALGAMAALASRIPWEATGAMALGGLVCAAMPALGQPIGSLGFAAGFAVPLLLQMKNPAAILPYPAMLLAMAAYALIPRKYWQRLLETLLLGAQEDASNLPPLQIAQGRMEEVAQCMDRLSSTFIQAEERASRVLPTTPITQALHLRVCGSCPRESLCQQDIERLLADTLAKAAERSSLWEEDFPKEFRDACPRLEAFMQVLAGAYGFYHVQNQQEKKLEEMRQLVGKQLSGMGQVLRRLSGELTLRTGDDSLRQRLVKQTLASEGYLVRHVQVSRDRDQHWLITLHFPSCDGHRVCSATVAPTLSRLFGRPLVADEISCANRGKYCRLTFRQAPVLQLESSGIQLPAKEICGDAMLNRQLEHPGYLLAISDGMGTGASAAREAHATLDLLESFYRAGFDEDIIFSGINQVLMMRSSRETYATVDLCLVDAMEGQARFIKFGAPPSYILRRNEVITIHAPTLPMGILEGVEPAITTRILQDGDMLVLLSDGVQGADNHWLLGFLARHAGDSPEALAKALLTESQKQWEHQDDRTVLTAQVRCPAGSHTEFANQQRLQLWKARVSG